MFVAADYIRLSFIDIIDLLTNWTTDFDLPSFNALFYLI